MKKQELISAIENAGLVIVNDGKLYSEFRSRLLNRIVHNFELGLEGVYASIVDKAIRESGDFEEIGSPRQIHSGIKRAIIGSVMESMKESIFGDPDVIRKLGMSQSKLNFAKQEYGLAITRCYFFIDQMPDDVPDGCAYNCNSSTETTSKEVTLEEISEGVERALELVNLSQLKFEQSKLEASMQNTPFATVNYVFGKDIKSMSAEELIAAIGRAQKQIADLKSVGDVDSKFIKGKIAETEAGIKKMVEQLDTLS